MFNPWSTCILENAKLTSKRNKKKISILLPETVATNNLWTVQKLLNYLKILERPNKQLLFSRHSVPIWTSSSQFKLTSNVARLDFFISSYTFNFRKLQIKTRTRKTV